MEQKSRYFAALLLLILFFESVLSMTGKSATWDEDLYLRYGYQYLLTGSARHGYDHPFTIVSLNSIPLFFMEKPFNRIYDSGMSAEKILFWTRMPTALLSLVLGYFIYMWAKELYGTKAGLLALFFYAFSPNIIAHSRLVTTDLPTTTVMFISAYFFWKFMREKTGLNSVYAGMAFGLALTGKQTSLFLVPVFFILSAADLIIKGEKSGIREDDYVKKLAVLLTVMAAAAFITFFATYAFSVGNLKQYFWGFWIKKGLLDAGQPTYLMGSYSENGFWYYFPVAFLIKTPIPFLLVFLLSLKALRGTQRNFYDELCLTVPVALIFLAFSRSNINIGLRYILPVYPFMFVFASKIAEEKNRALGVFVILLLIWYPLESAMIFPHYLAYFNQLAGGPGNGYKYLADSNNDWGQDLPGLKRYVTEHDIGEIKLAYFGTASLEYYNISYEYLPTAESIEKIPEGVEVECGKTKGLIAISATTLSGVYLPQKDCYDWLNEYEPIHKIGYSIFIYNITG